MNSPLNLNKKMPTIIMSKKIMQNPLYIKTYINYIEKNINNLDNRKIEDLKNAFISYNQIKDYNYTEKDLFKNFLENTVIERHIWEKLNDLSLDFDKGFMSNNNFKTYNQLTGKYTNINIIVYNESTRWKYKVIIDEILEDTLFKCLVTRLSWLNCNLDKITSLKSVNIHNLEVEVSPINDNFSKNLITFYKLLKGLKKMEKNLESSDKIWSSIDYQNSMYKKTKELEHLNKWFLNLKNVESLITNKNNEKIIKNNKITFILYEDKKY